MNEIFPSRRPSPNPTGLNLSRPVTRRDALRAGLFGTVGLWLFCALLAAAAANVVMFEAVKVLGPTRAMLFQFLVPAFAVAMASIFLGEAIVAGQVAGGAVIVLGILVARSRRLGTRFG